MSTTQDFIDFVIDQMIDVKGEIRYKKMFGEYMVYVNDKPLLLVCDNRVFIKMLPDLEQLMSGAAVGYPYEGAKMHYMLDVEDSELLLPVLEILEQQIPVPKPRKKPNPNR